MTFASYTDGILFTIKAFLVTTY